MKPPRILTDRRSNGLARDPLAESSITQEIIGAFFAVYNELGFGFLESVYVRSLQVELKARGLRSQREAPVDVIYRGEDVGFFRVDLFVERRVIVEVKSINALAEPERKQVLNYLKATKVEVGLLLNFGPKARFMRLVSTTSRKPARTRNPTHS